MLWENRFRFHHNTHRGAGDTHAQRKREREAVRESDRGAAADKCPKRLPVRANVRTHAPNFPASSTVTTGVAHCSDLKPATVRSSKSFRAACFRSISPAALARVGSKLCHAALAASSAAVAPSSFSAESAFSFSAASS